MYGFIILLKQNLLSECQSLGGKKYFKGTLMRISKSPDIFVFIKKQYPENFAFLILRIFKLLALEVCKLLKK